MSNLKVFLKEMIGPIVSKMEFTEDNAFSEDVNKSVDELLLELNNPTEGKQEKRVFTVSAEDVLSEHVTEEELVRGILALVELTGSSVSELKDLPFDIEVQEIRGMEDLALYQGLRQKFLSFPQRVHELYLSRLIEDEYLIVEAVMRDYPILSEPEVNDLILYSERIIDHRKRIDLIDTLAQYQAEFLTEKILKKI